MQIQFLKIISGVLLKPNTNLHIPPLVSVLMTAFNREAYIAEAIKSVLASEYENFELIIVDDASTDNTAKVATFFSGNDKRVKLYVNEKNLGQFANRNKAAFYAAGEFLKYVDSDDKIYPHTLNEMVNQMRSFPKAGLGICVLQEQVGNIHLPCFFLSKEAIRKHYLQGGFLFAGPSGIIIKKEVFDAVGRFEEFGMPSDNHFVLKVTSRYPIVAMNTGLFWWRTHEGQVFSQNVGNAYNILNNYHYSKDIVIKHSPLSKAENKKIMQNLHKIFYRNLYRLAFKKKKPLLAVKFFFKRNKKNEIDASL